MFGKNDGKFYIRTFHFRAIVTGRFQYFPLHLFLFVNYIVIDSLNRKPISSQSNKTYAMRIRNIIPEHALLGTV